MPHPRPVAPSPCHHVATSRRRPVAVSLALDLALILNLTVSTILVQVRDLQLQPAGPRQSVGGTRSLTRFTIRRAEDRRLWTPQRTHFFPLQFQARALAVLCAAYGLRTHRRPGVSAFLGDLPAEILHAIIAASTGREQIDHTTCQIRMYAFDSDEDAHGAVAQ